MKQQVRDRLDQSKSGGGTDTAPLFYPAAAIAHRDKLISLIDKASRRRNRNEVFGDFVTMAEVAMARLDLQEAARREQLYRDCAAKYTEDELLLFPQMMDELVEGLSCCPRDMLGEIYMMLDLGSTRSGQFFTPYHLCQLMAQVTFAGVTVAEAEAKGFINIHEPACGAGAMAIASLEFLRDQGINYQRQAHVTAIDLDSTAAKMAFIQLSLLGAPATVINGNSLSGEQFEVWHTPVFIIDLWSLRLARRRAQQPAPTESGGDAAKTNMVTPEEF